MNFLLLDIDGVMVPAQSWKAPTLLNDGFPAFSSKATYVLQQLLTTHTAIVLTTSHKSNYSIDEWKQIFQRRGIAINQLSTLPPNTEHLNRRQEIERWYATNTSIRSFLIIDDDPSLSHLPPQLSPHLLKTQSSIGLTEEMLEEGLRILGI